MKITKIDERKYEVEVDGIVTVYENEKDFITDKRTGETYIKNLPENPYLKSVSLKRIDKNGGVLIVDTVKKDREVSGEKVSKKVEDYLTEEEKQTIANILALGRKRMEEEKEKAQKMKENPRYKELLKMKKNLLTLIESGMNIPMENIERIDRELEKLS